MLNEKGQLTDIGSWYLGGPATGIIPNDGVAGPVGKHALWGSVLMTVLFFVAF